MPAPMMIARDPPDHTRMRRIVANRFTPRSLARWNERIEAIAERLIAAVLEEGRTDIAASVAMPIVATARRVSASARVCGGAVVMNVLTWARRVG